MNKVKDGKAAGSDGVHTEMIKAGGDEVLKWLVRLFNACWINGEVPTDWKEAMIVPLYKGKGERSWGEIIRKGLN